ncbi:hypothetical protein [Altibacter sp. HG106]|uniref:hypothetical protein n=1 Tax=Altibacter sp. HG106 TaxID=3023937 RepID=UPI00234FD387|nr:hypothetical protein [Altibacter sp. HG106]MDC7993596.1 hypothetical protein [Altibacter sp. HG106]
MNNISERIEQFSAHWEIFLLMLSAFLIGYFFAWWTQKSKFGTLTKRLKEEVNQLQIEKQKINNIDTIFSEIRPKIVKVVKETQEEINVSKPAPKIAASPDQVAAKAKTSFVTYAKSKPELNFDNFGYADADAKDDLTKINGIGPYIELKLNEIGIFNFDQISRFDDSDIRTITELIDFFPGRIDRDNWVGQAKALKVY